MLDAAPFNFFSYLFIWLRQVLAVARGDFVASWGIVAEHGLQLWGMGSSTCSTWAL